MRVWRRKPEEEESPASVAGTALAGASHAGLVREGLRALTQKPCPDRVGIWLESDINAQSSSGFSGVFHGFALDRSSREECPPEWKILSLEPPLPEQLLLRAEPFEQNLNDSVRNAVIGQLVGLRRALWVPVADQNRVRGLILLGSASSPLAPFLDKAKSVAAELALALRAEEQFRAARIGNAELDLVRHIVESRLDVSSLNRLLAQLVEDCVHDSAKEEGIGASFAAIGVINPQAGLALSAAQADFRWRSGDELWTRALGTDPVAKLWRHALETRQIAGSEVPVTWAQASVTRVVALPLETEGQLLGILVAGFPAAAASIAILSRLELRARLAASTLLRSKRIEEESRRANAEQSLVDLVSDPIFLLDNSGRITATSRGARELLRRAGQAAVLPSGNISDLFCSQDRERLRKWFQQVLDPASPAQAVQREAPQAELQSGVKVRVRLAPSLQGQAPIVLLEPQETFESQPNADHAEAELRNVIEWVEEGVLLFDAHENVRAVNTRFEQMAGLAPEESGKLKTLEEWIARLAEQAVEPTQFAERWRELARNIQGGVREPMQMALPVPRVLERAARPVLDGIGRQVGRVEIYRDLTAERVFHSKLLQTEKLAALGQMVSGVAHELSNPLTSILGYAQRLLVAQSGPGQNALERAEEVRQIYQEAERAATILRQLLLSARETIPERRLVSLNQVVMRATELQRFTLAAEKIRVELDLDPALPFVQGDGGQLQQVLINLLSNARHALEEQSHGGVIRLRTRRASDRRLLLEVEDNGPGIPQAIQARIFDPFFTTKPAGVGTGLGLSIVLSVVREHGGQVRLQSPPQGGALFQIELPAATERQQEEARPALLREHGTPLRERKRSLVDEMQFTSTTVPQAAQLENPVNAPARQSAVAEHAPVRPLGKEVRARVLVVEDEPTVARLIADVLEDEGLRVDVLFDGRAALERAARESYDLVICDMKMPGLDGQHFYRSLVRNGNSLRERFLFVTGDVMGAHTREFLRRNRLPHVAKPFRVEELTEKVHAMLQTQDRTHEEPSASEAAKKNAARNG
jgi:signal transduction histidine kinase/FixJ family two-component response regulator